MYVGDIIHTLYSNWKIITIWDYNKEYICTYVFHNNHLKDLYKDKFKITIDEDRDILL